MDYGLVDRDGRLLEDPISYRDGRTEDIMPRVFARVPREEIFARTGIQFLPINTLFQLAAHVEQGLPGSAHRLLMIPDLVTAALTGREVTEFTNATTTQMVHIETRRWDTGSGCLHRFAPGSSTQARASAPCSRAPATITGWRASR